MATQTLATADAILKDLYVGPVVEQINQKTYMIDQIERDVDSVDHTGRRAVFPVHINRNRGRGSRQDNSTLPTAGAQGYEDGQVPIRYHYQGMEVSDPAIEASKGNEGAFVNILEEETKGVGRDMRKDINRQVYGTGDGLLATVRASSTTNTVNVDQGIQYIGVGDPIDVLDRSTGTINVQGVLNATVLTRTASSATPTITISPNLGGTATTAFGVYLAGVTTGVTTTTMAEMDGLRNIINTSRTLHGINSATAGNEFWNGVRLDANNNIATESLFEQLADNVGQNGNGEIDAWVTTRGIRRRLADTYQSQKRFNDANAVKIHGGYTAIMVNEMPVVFDDDAPKGFAFGINKDSFRWFEQTKPGWLEQKDGGVFHLKNSATAGTRMNVWQAWFRWYAALGSKAPGRNGILYNCADDFSA